MIEGKIIKLHNLLAKRNSSNVVRDKEDLEGSDVTASGTDRKRLPAACGNIRRARDRTRHKAPLYDICM
jgi:hypothetical protein